MTFTTITAITARSGDSGGVAARSHGSADGGGGGGGGGGTSTLCSPVLSRDVTHSRSLTMTHTRAGTGGRFSHFVRPRRVKCGRELQTFGDVCKLKTAKL